MFLMHRYEAPSLLRRKLYTLSIARHLGSQSSSTWQCRDWMMEGEGGTSWHPQSSRSLGSIRVEEREAA